MTLLLISTEVLSVLRHVALSVLSLDVPCILDEIAVVSFKSLNYSGKALVMSRYMVLILQYGVSGKAQKHMRPNTSATESSCSKLLTGTASIMLPRSNAS